jgi:hypothetical protein
MDVWFPSPSRCQCTHHLSQHYGNERLCRLCDCPEFRSLPGARWAKPRATISANMARANRAAARSLNL